MCNIIPIITYAFSKCNNLISIYNYTYTHTNVNVQPKGILEALILNNFPLVFPKSTVGVTLSTSNAFQVMGKFYFSQISVTFETWNS